MESELIAKIEALVNEEVEAILAEAKTFAEAKQIATRRRYVWTYGDLGLVVDKRMSQLITERALNQLIQS